MVTYIKDIILTDGTHPGSKVTFILEDGKEYKGKISDSGFFKGYYIYLDDTVTPYELFTRIGISQIRKFFNTVLGYCGNGAWPVSKSREDLSKLLMALRYYRGESDVTPEEEKKFTLKVKKHKQTKLNFKL